MMPSCLVASYHPSDGPATTTLYHATSEMPRYCLGGTGTFDHSLHVQGTVTATIPRNFSHEKPLEAAPMRSASMKRLFEEAEKPILSPEIRRPWVDVSAKLVIVMVGLPARGKSYVTKKLCRYMNWLQHDTKIFNVGNRRRKVAGCPLDSAAHGCCSDLAGATPAISEKGHEAGFFDPENLQASRLREQVAMETLDELLDYLLNEDGSIAIFDATNSTIQRRRLIVNMVRERAGPKLRVLFVESQCFDESVCMRFMPRLTAFVSGLIWPYSSFGPTCASSSQVRITRIKTQSPHYKTSRNASQCTKRNTCHWVKQRGARVFLTAK